MTALAPGSCAVNDFADADDITACTGRTDRADRRRAGLDRRRIFAEIQG